MEDCPRLPALNFDLKLSIESINLCEKIPNYITTNYQDNGENYSNECEQINCLRQNATNCSMDDNGLLELKRYYVQLQLLKKRFPMLHDGECAVRFTWEDAYQKEENTYDDIRFEETCILYNIGSLYSKLGANQLRKTHESMKNACTYFRYSSGCYEKLRDQYMVYSLDLTPDLLTCQIDTLLGQAHEAVLEKSLFDRRPASVNAHLAMQISQYYHQALTNLLKSGINSIVSKKFREWRVALTYKSSFYLSVTYYFCGLIANDSKKYGESICYFENALQHIKDAWKNAEKISSDRTAIYKDAHRFTLDILMEKYKTNKHDNENVYFEKVPILSSLPTIQGVIVAKSQAFDYHNSNVLNVDIFQKLIPMDTHLIASEYSEEKAKLLRDIIELIENKNRELETFLNCLQLNRIPFNTNYLQLPQEFIDCCVQCVHRSTMSQELKSIMQLFNQQHDITFEEITKFEQLLFDTKYQTLKSTNDYQDIEQNLKSIHNILIQTNESTMKLNQHLLNIIEHFQILHLPIEQIEKHLPIIIELNEQINKPKLVRLTLLNEKVQTMKQQREIFVENLRKKIQDDDITKFILLNRQENHKNLFCEQLKKHDELINLIKQNCLAQEPILQALTDANADIAEIRTNISKTYENRQRTIEEFIQSFHSFDESISKAREGIEFYKKQNENIHSLNERFIQLQFNEQKQSIINHSTIVPNRARLIDYLPIMKPETWNSNQINNNHHHHNINNLSQTISNNNNKQFYYPEQNHLQQTQMIAQPLSQQFYSTNQIQHSSIDSYQHCSHLNRPTIIQSTTMSTKFDPYHPQPIGAYDIPKFSQINNQQLPALINPQDVYRPGGLLGINSTMNFPNYDVNPYGQYIPPS